MLKKSLSIVLQTVVLIVFFILIALMVKYLDETGLRDRLTSWIAARENFVAILYIAVAAALYSVWTPGNVLGAMGYILFGYVKGTILFSIAGIVSCIFTFFIVRRFFQKRFQRYIEQRPKLINIQDAFKEQGLPFYFLIWISPFHALVINALFAVSTVRRCDYFLSLLALIPQWMLFVYFGYCAASAVDSSPFSTPSILRYISLAVFVGVIIYIAQLTQKIIKDA